MDEAWRKNKSLMFSSDQPFVSNQLGDTDWPESYESFIEIFDREYKKLIDTVNTKEGGVYLPYESATFKSYANPNNPQGLLNVYRKVIYFGSLPNATSKSVSHNINFTSVCTLTQLFGAATDPSTMSYIPLPFSSPTLVENISLSADETSVTIETGADYSSYVNVSVVIEYLKDM